MRKIVYFIAILLIATACGTYRSLDLRKLTTGMTKAQVEKVAGLPNRVLAINETEDGYQEVLEYRTSSSEVYALEFWNDYLTGYEYLYDDVNYVAPLYPPTIYPPYGRPIIVVPPAHNQPNRPNRPSQPNRPNRPTQPNRPSQPGNSNRPNRPAPTTRPTEGSRPVGTPNSSSGRDRTRENNTQQNGTDRSRER